MPKFLIFEIPGVPIPKARHKTSRRGRHLMHYDPQHLEKKWTESFIACSYQALDQFGSNVPLQAEFNFSFKPASNDPKTNNLFSWGFLEHTSKPDCTNLAKFYEDILNSYVYHDDRQLISVSINKFYSNEDKTIIKIMPKKTYDHSLNQFLEILNVDDFCQLSHRLHKLALIIESQQSKNSNDCRFELAKAAFSVLHEIASNHSKQLIAIAKKTKISLTRKED